MKRATVINLNHVVISGSLTGDPVLTTMRSGDVACVMQLACTRNARDRRTGGWNQWRDYFWVRAYGTHARAAHRYLSKGRGVAIQGHLTYHREEPERFEIVAREMQFLDNSSRATDTEDDDPILDEDDLLTSEDDRKIVAAGMSM